MADNSANRRQLFAGASAPSLGSGDAGRAHETSAQVLEADNNEMWDRLHSKAEILKGHVSGTFSELQRHNQMLSGVANSATHAGGLLGTTMQQLDSMIQAGGGGNVCMLVGFIVAVFLLLYFFVLR